MNLDLKGKIFICINELSNSDLITLSVGILTVSVGSITAYFLYKTLKSSQMQNELTLAINQYEILYRDLQIIINGFKNIDFRKFNTEDYPRIRGMNFEDADGMNNKLFGLFAILKEPECHLLNKQQIYHFQDSVLDPLLWQYDILNKFLNEVKQDKLLTDSYKKKLYRKIEQDVLQIYFRICNNKVFGTGGEILRNRYNFTIFTIDRQDGFYSNNNFYKENQLFQIETEEFYQKIH